MSTRYYLDTPPGDGTAMLTGSEAQHLARVMRVKPGDEVTLFDGSGQEFAAQVETVGRSEVELSILSRRHVDRELPFPLTVGVALPKGERQRWLVEKLTELGVSRIVPLRTERGVAVATSSALARLRRTVVESSKQCGRNVLMEIGEPEECRDFFGASCDTVRVIAHPGGQGFGAALSAGQVPTHLAIGPEGGFSDEETAQAMENGWLPVGLGPRILRVESAAVALTAALIFGAPW